MLKQLLESVHSDRFCRVQNLPTSSVELIWPITEVYFRQILSTDFMNRFYQDVNTGPYNGWFLFVFSFLRISSGTTTALLWIRGGCFSSPAFLLDQMQPVALRGTAIQALYHNYPFGRFNFLPAQHQPQSPSTLSSALSLSLSRCFSRLR